MRPVLEDLLYFEYVEPPSSVDRVIVEKSRRHECLEPTNASRLREEHKHSALLSALIHDSSSEEYESDHENLISSDEELQESTFFDFSEAPSKVEYEMLDRLNRHDVTIPTNPSSVRQHLTVLHLSSSSENDSDFETLISSDEEVLSFVDFTEAPSRVEYEVVVDRLNRHYDVTPVVCE